MEDDARRWSWPLLAATGATLLLAGTAGWLWVERMPIATSYIDDALAARGVPARYQLAQIGFRTQRIENVRIGDPARPDLVADWIELRLSVGVTGVRVAAVDAGGVQLRAKLVGEKLSFGVIDRLLPKAGPHQKVSLPDLALTARAIRLDLTLPAGLVQASLNGSGHLRDDFQGHLAIASTRLASGGCMLAMPAARLSIAIDEGQPRVAGPVGAEAFTCDNAKLSAPRLDVNLRGDAALTAWRGSLLIRNGRLNMGETSAALAGGIRFDTDGRRIRGRADLAAQKIVHGRSRAVRASAVGDYRLDPAAGRFQMDGTLRLSGVQLDPAITTPLAAAAAAADGIPAGPILSAWSEAAGRAAQRIDARAGFTISHGPSGGAVRIGRAHAESASGGRLLVEAAGGAGLGWIWPDGGAVANVDASLFGGGLPGLRVSLRQAAPATRWSGTATVASYRAGGARLRVAPIEMAPGEHGITRVTSRITMDGPVADGWIEGLDLPVEAVIGADGRLLVNPRCAPLSFERLDIAGTVLSAAALPLCPRDGALIGRTPTGRLHGGARVAGPRLRGRIGDQPLEMHARAILVDIGRPGAALNGLSVRLGEASEPTTLDISRLTAAAGTSGLSGRFEGLNGKLAPVPLVFGGGQGDWRLRAGELGLAGQLTVSDAETTSPRFHPLISDDVRLTLKGGRIGATATLREPRSMLPVTDVAIRHDLASGNGDARLAVDKLRFGNTLQPEAVTPLTVGVIANVEGAVDGFGEIRWAGGKVVSEGNFSTDGLDFAAAFGPVSGMKGRIRFTDLLGMVTAPDQEVRVAEINPGVAVRDGVIRYRILADRKLALASGQWPFSGGTLTLDPTLLDMGQPVARRLTFRIDGLDSATFVQQLEFKNIAVTGKFDGVLPIIFDSRGGRIEKGELTARPEGGTLSYVGDVTNAELGRIARIAFDALKSMRYRQLRIDLDGDLDGEIVSRVRFLGTNNQPSTNAQSGGFIGRMLAPVTRLPFRFNITVTAPFRGLVNSAQTFVDPSIALRNSQAGALPGPAAGQSDIQPR